MNVFIIGFMGSGKTSIGKTLAKNLKLSFIDMDQSIEEKANEKISSIFDNNGEDFFRKLETKWLKNYSDNNYVISVGGGTPCFNENLELMHQKGIVVYLTIPISMIAQRLINSKTIRPIIEPFRHDQVALLKFIGGLLAEREPFYKQADLIFEASNMSANKYKLLTEMIEKVNLRNV